MSGASAVGRGRSRAAFAATVLSFGVLGLVSGGWQVLLAELKGSLALSPGAVGALLTGGVLVSLPAMVVAGRLSDRFGPRALVAGTGVLLAVGLLGFGAVGGYLALFPVVGVYNAGLGSFDVGMNAAAMDVEGAADGTVMSYFHAAYSGFAALGALVAGRALGAGVGFRSVYLALAAVPAVFVVGVLLTDRYPSGSGSGGGSGDGDADERSLFRNRAILLVAAVVALGFFAEGSMTDWSTIYVRSALDVPVSAGAVGVASFHAAMTAGRLGGARATDAFGPRRLLQAVGVLGATGMAVALATDVFPVVVVGFAVVGVAMAVVAPIGFSVAGALAPDRSGEASSVVTFVGYGAFLVGPVLIGGVADAASLAAAFALVAVAGVGIAVLAGRIPDGE